MATYNDTLTEYRRKYSDLHKQIAEKTGSSQEEITNLFDDLLQQTQQEEKLLSELSSNPQFLYNWLRHLALQFKRLSDLFENVCIEEQHRFCQYIRAQLPAPTPAYMDVLAATKLAISYASKDFGHLVFTNPDCGREELIVWIQSYLDHEVQVLLFTQQWEILKSRLQAQARSKTKTPEEAEDLLMEVSFKALKYIRVHHELPDEKIMRAWLSTIMNHAYLDGVRDQANLLIEPILDEEDEMFLDEEDMEERAIEKLERQELENILQSLPEDAHTVMELHLLQGIPLSEIADKLGEKHETIRARYKRARPHLVARLPAKTLTEYLARVPNAYTKIQKVIQNYIPRRSASKYNLTGLLIETEDDIIIRYLLSSHIEGYDSHEIAELLSLKKGNKETEEAFAQRMATTQRNIQKCLQENLPRLFSFFYEKNR